MTDFSTLAVHGGYNANRNDDAVSVPIYASAAFDLENAVRGRDLAAGEISGFEYSRVANPTVDALERRLAALEGLGEDGTGRGTDQRLDLMQVVDVLDEISVDAELRQEVAERID